MTGGRQVAASGADRLDLGAVIADRQTKIIICCGSGGVGKTTTSAALAVRPPRPAAGRWC